MAGNFFENNKKYFIVILGALVVILGFTLLWPYLTTLLGAAFLAYLFHPLYRKIKKKIKNEVLSASILLILVLILLTVPLFFSVQYVVDDIVNVYTNFVDSGLANDPEVSRILSSSLDYISNSISGFIKSIPSLVIHTIVMLFAFYYFLKDGGKFVNTVKEILPLENKKKNEVINEFKTVTSAVIYGMVLTAFIEFILALIAFYIFGVSSPIFWSLVVFVLTMLPVVGGSLIWLPAAIIKILAGDYVSGIGLLLFGLLIISNVENIIRPKLIGDKAQMHPLTTLLGVFGGLHVFGLFGIIWGPLILNMAFTLIKTTKLWK
jgi:predicted PurR-regulated permease PerM